MQLSVNQNKTSTKLMNTIRKFIHPHYNSFIHLLLSSTSKVLTFCLMLLAPFLVVYSFIYCLYWA